MKNNGFIAINKYQVKSIDKIIDEAFELKIYQSNRQYIVTFMGYTIYIAEEYQEAFNHFLMVMKTLTMITLPEPMQTTLKILGYPSFKFKVNENKEIIFMVEESNINKYNL